MATRRTVVDEVEDRTPEVSPEAQALVNQGARPVEVDVASLLKMIQSQQDQLNALLAERGIATNPVEATLQALWEHLKAQGNANPAHDDSYREVTDYVAQRYKNPNDLTLNHAMRVRMLVDELRERHPQHELGYVHTLTRELMKHATEEE